MSGPKSIEPSLAAAFPGALRDHAAAAVAAIPPARWEALGRFDAVVDGAHVAIPDRTYGDEPAAEGWATPPLKISADAQNQ